MSRQILAPTISGKEYRLAEIFTLQTDWSPESLSSGDMEIKDIESSLVQNGDIAISSLSSNREPLIISSVVHSGVVRTMVYNQTGDAVDLDPGILTITIIKFQ